MDEAALLDVISGSRQGWSARLIRCGLSVLTVPYGTAVRLRNAAFDCGLKRTYQAGVPVVSVGNLTTGGTGKTPFVAYLADWLQLQGKQPAILSRGYRSLPGEVNDEKLVLDRLCPGVPHLQQPDRVASARQATSHGAGALILDDGFQHRRLGRDLDLVLIDALNPFGYGSLLPRGLLREPLTSIRRASAVIITRADQVPSSTLEQIAARLRQAAGPAHPLPCLHVAYPVTELLGADGTREPISNLRGKRVLAFCGIGNPGGFLATVTSAGLTPAAGEDRALLSFPDHHHYSAADLDQIAQRAGELQADAIVTTLKDLVKLTSVSLDGRPLRAIGIGTHILRGETELHRLLRQAFPVSRTDG